MFFYIAIECVNFILYLTRLYDEKKKKKTNNNNNNNKINEYENAIFSFLIIKDDF